jgi:hypothetical protein
VTLALTAAIGSAVAALAAGGAVWPLLNPPARLSLRAPRPPGPRRRADLSAHWLSLAGLSLTPARLASLTWGVGVLAAVGAMAALRNPVAALAFGYLASGLPEAYVRRRARTRWQALDHAALVATTNLRYWLERGSSVLLALRELSQSTDEPFRGWLLACLREEAGLTDGRRVEDVLRQRARGIHHVELMLLADLLAVERRRGSTTESLDELVEQWMARIRADARRRGTISGTLLLSRHMITICAGVLVLLGTTHAPAVASAAGLLVYGLGVMLVALAAYVQRGVLRQAEAI